MSNLNISSCSLDDNHVINIFPHCLLIKNNISELNISYNLLIEKIFDLLTLIIIKFYILNNFFLIYYNSI